MADLTIENTKSWLSPETFSPLERIWFCLLKIQAFNISRVAQLVEHHYKAYMAYNVALVATVEMQVQILSWLNTFLDHMKINSTERLYKINFTLLSDSIIPGRHIKALRMFSF